jgi:colanic acid/amylovoran biosynthesis glycosyltransferase
MEPEAVTAGRRVDVVALVGDFPAFSKTFVVDQLVGLVRAGHRVSIIADPPLPGGDAQPGDVPDELRGRITYRNRPGRRLPGNRVRFARAVVRGLRAGPRAVVEILLDRGSTLYRRMLLLETLAIVAKVGDADVFHCHFGMLGDEMVRVRQALRYRGRVVTAFHGFDISSYVERFGPTAFDGLFAAGDLFLPISDHWRDRLIALGAPAARVEVQRMGVDITGFEPIDRAAPGDVWRILSVGRLVEKKGNGFALQAIAALNEQGASLEYTIVGEGRERGRLERTIAELGLQEVTRLVGARSRREVYELMLANDVFLSPSVTASDGDVEGIPMVLMEAMATAMPVVATWHSGIPELVRDGWSGLLVEEWDVRGLAERIRSICTDPHLATQLGSNGRATVEAEYDLARLMERLQERLERVALHPSA